jgi:hypothetical protein
LSNYLISTLSFFGLCIDLFSQPQDSLQKNWEINFDIRPRLELTSNYKVQQNDTISPGLMLTQRNRISITYRKLSWLIRTDFQEIHFWDRSHLFSKVGSLNFYQLYLETRFEKWNIRIGRQGVLLDNGRIFSDAPWAQQSRSHDGARLIYQKNQVKSDLFFLLKTNFGNHFNPSFSPVGSNKYKNLLIHHFSVGLEKGYSLNTITAWEIIKNESTKKTLNRFTLGGRIEFKRNHLNYTLNSYMQFGQSLQGKKLLAYYAQPEIRLTKNSLTLRLGSELLSGTSPKLNSNYSGDFDVLYGVAWKFMGNMNFFTRFPSDVGGKGLLNPYLFISFEINKKITLRNDIHFFFSQFPLKNEFGESQKKFLGIESDLSLRYKTPKNREIHYGISFLKPTSTLKYLPKILNEKEIAFWNYIMISFN